VGPGGAAYWSVDGGLRRLIVAVATPTIRPDLHASGAALQLIVAGYTIAYAVL
jgi:hypothetical protein